MVCTWVYQMRKTELADIPESLHVGSIKKRKEVVGHTDMAMYRVFYCFHLCLPLRINIYLLIKLLCHT
jgi:hypothetical protein